MSTAKAAKSPWFVSRADFIATIIVAALIAIGVLVNVILRLVAIVPNENVPVLARIREDASLPLNGGGAVPVIVHDVTVMVSDLPGLTYASVLLAEILPALAMLIVIGGVLLLCRNLMTGRVFAPGNARTIGIISIAIIAGWVFDNLFSTMASNGAIAAASDRQLEAVTFGFDFMPVFVSMAVALVAAAFHAGGRLQRETEGLV